MNLSSQVLAIASLSPSYQTRMFELMCSIYDGMVWETFLQDLQAKDEAILLFDDEERLMGFSTQVEHRIPYMNEGQATSVRGIFSGDTVIAEEAWGSPELFMAFANTYCRRAETYRATTGEELYWFIISKGHRTYRILPTFFKTFYPTHRSDTPKEAQAIMDAYASTLFPQDYDPSTGVIAYQFAKDRLKDNVAYPDPARLTQPDIKFFIERNPGWSEGHDLVCLTRLHPDNLRFPERMLR